MSEGQPPRERSTLLAYVVMAGLGLSFSAVLFVNAWRNVMEDARRDFEVESASFRTVVAANVRNADEVLNSFAVFAEVNGLEEAGELETYARQLLARHPYLSAAAVYAPGEPWRQLAGLAARPALAEALATLPGRDGGGASHLRLALETGAVTPGPLLHEGPLAGHYCLARRIAPAGAGEPRVAAVFVSARELVSAAAIGERLGASLVANSFGVGGRHVLLERGGDAPGEPLRRLSMDTQVQFPSYSMRLAASKGVHWSDIDLGPLLIALVIGGGTMLLMVALAHARETQARELRQRNAVIEQQVLRQTRELAEARDQALEASRVKSEFLASMSHEIRTPLNAIIGMAELLAETPLHSDQARYVGVFRRAGEALLSLVNDILDLSKIEAGQLELEAIELELKEVLEASVEIHALKCQEKGVALRYRIAPDLPPVLVGDPARLRQVCLNLIGNAIKFTEQGEIELSAEPERSRPAGHLRISVRDTGIGIPPEKREAIFGSFTQVDSSTTRRYGGTGLGLTISRKLVEMMGGRIWVESELGRGSTFQFTVALGVGEARRPAEPAPPAADLEGLRVLVADDDATNCLVIERTLAARGVQVETAPGGQQALAAFAAARAQGAAHHGIIADARMPGMDGGELVANLCREGADPGSILMLSSGGLGSERERLRALGVESYLVKPVKAAELLAAVQRLAARQRPAGAAAPAAAPPGAAAGRRPVLLVEDTADNRLLIRAYLKKTGIELDEAENGEIAVRKFKQGDYALVLMDVQMPVMDGHAATREIRAFERAEGRPPTPIIALTAHALREEMDKSLAAGCTTHLTKPIKKAVLLEALESYLGAA